MTVNWSLQHYTDTAANLNARATPILEGQFAIETDNITTTPKFKIGDGVSLYSALPYANGTGIFQPLATNLTSLSGLTYASTSFVKMTAAGAFALDTASYQPLDADLTSWAGVTRASGFDTFATTPSSANLSSLLTDKTGTGVNVFGTSPTFTTDITTPLIIGGSAVGSTIQYKGTSGNGTSTVAAHQFLVGNNGATTAAQIFNSGQVSIGNYATPTNLRILTIGQDTSYISFGSRADSTGVAAIYMNIASPSGVANNATLSATANTTVLNAAQNVIISNGGITSATFGLNTVVFAPSALAGKTTSFTFTCPAHTNQTASTESENFKVTGNTKTWANGGAATTIATQRWNWFTANTAATSGGGSLTITNSYGIYAEAATVSGVTITNNYAIGTNGDVDLTGGNRVLRSSGGNLRLDCASGSVVRLDVSGTASLTASSTQITLRDPMDFVLGTSTGTKFGTATTQKLAFWNATPIVQPTTAVTAATFVANTSGTLNDSATFDGYTIGQVVKALRNIGLLA